VLQPITHVLSGQRVRDDYRRSNVDNDGTGGQYVVKDVETRWIAMNTFRRSVQTKTGTSGVYRITFRGRGYKIKIGF